MIRPSMRMVQRHPDDQLPDIATVLPGANPARDLGGEDRPPGGLRTIRSEAYRRWRFEQHPTASYLRVDADRSTAVLRVNRRKGRDELVVSELIGAGGRRAVSKAAQMSRAGYLVSWFSAGSPERREAIRAGLIPVPRMVALNMVARPLRELGAGFDVFDPNRWDLSLSDLELL